MKSTIEYGSEDARMHTGPIAERDLEMHMEFPIDKNPVSLEWVSICLADPVSLDQTVLS